MRQFLADAAYWLAYRSLRRAERTGTVAWKIRWLRRSEFWSDVECWIAGLGAWRDLRQRRVRSRQAAARRIDLHLRGVAF